MTLGIQSTNNFWPYDTPGLHFAHAENNIRFEYTGISFKSGGDITYRYRLTGPDDNRQTTKENYLIYPTLPSGDYVLQVIATNKSGVVSKLATVRFTIEKLLWEKTWLRLPGVILPGAGIWIFVQYRIKQIREQEAARANTNRKISEPEQMVLKVRINPHFILTA